MHGSQAGRPHRGRCVTTGLCGSRIHRGPRAGAKSSRASIAVHTWQRVHRGRPQPGGPRDCRQWRRALGACTAAGCCWSLGAPLPLPLACGCICTHTRRYPRQFCDRCSHTKPQHTLERTVSRACTGPHSQYLPSATNMRRRRLQSRPIGTLNGTRITRRNAAAYTCLELTSCWLVFCWVLIGSICEVCPHRRMLVANTGPEISDAQQSARETPLDLNTCKPAVMVKPQLSTDHRSVLEWGGTELCLLLLGLL